MKHISLFSGIGGFDLASEWMGWENVAHCEWNTFCQQILKYYWPKAISYEDITKTDFSIHRGNIDIITGGFPCQPYSVAGLRKGKKDERHLWPHMLRAIREIKPRWVVGENVLGLVSWNDGMVFEEVQADLEAEGYEVQPFILPAAAINAPHRRDRVWFVAYATSCSERSSRKSRETESDRSQFNDKQGRRRSKAKLDNGCGELLQFITNTYSRRQPGKEHGKEKSGRFTEKSIPEDWENFPTKSPICDGDDGISSRLDVDTVLKSVGRKVNSKFKPFGWWRNESIKGGGNAIVPQVALNIFKAIEAYEQSI